MNRMKSLVLGTIALTLAVGLLVPAGAAAKGKANTKVLFGGANSNPDDTQYYGGIESSKKACANKRKVTVYMKGTGRDEKIGSTKSEPGKGGTYFWDVIQTDPPQAGTYYARAKVTDDCRGDRSKDFDFNR